MVVVMIDGLKVLFKKKPLWKIVKQTIKFTTDREPIVEFHLMKNFGFGVGYQRMCKCETLEDARVVLANIVEGEDSRLIVEDVE
jgi:hypothetical protein